MLLMYPRPTRFLVVTRGRSGSNLLMSMLESHPDIRAYREVFGETALQDTCTRELIATHGPAGYLKRLMTRERHEKAVGFKLLYYQLKPWYATSMSAPDLTSVRELLIADHDLRVVHLIRRNTLHILVSHELMHATGEVARTVSTCSGNDAQLQLSPEKCIHEFERTELWQDEWDAAFDQAQKLTIYYSDLTHDREKTSRRIMDFLGVDHQSLTSPLRKQNTRTMRQVVLNYDELKAVFSNTKWARFFDE